MFVSKNWLQDFVFLPDSLDSQELATALTMKTVEVEGYEEQRQALDRVVVAKISRVEKHPDADRLAVCTVDSGEGDVQVVCGGSNVKKGMKVALGHIGAKVRWHGAGDLVELKKTKIRGVESMGMICASDEIGLGALYPEQDEKEILDLSDSDAAPGTPLAEALGMNDVIFDIDNKSMTHRPDLWGHYGMAREVAAIYHKKIQPYKVKDIKEGKGLHMTVDVQDTAVCPRYMAVAIEGVSVEPSPDWMQKRLLAVGVRPINVIVDITNYVMFELGQPMHAFDLEQLETQGEDDIQTLALRVRRADAEETFVALNEKEYELNPEMLVIANAGKAVALAGVIGGDESGVDEDTSTIVLESANFDPTVVRKAATALGARTDSSTRFEKSLDPAGAETALKRAVELILMLCPGAKVASNVVDVDHSRYDRPAIEVPIDVFQKKIGMLIKEKEMVDILERLGFGVKSKKEMFYVTVPSWRATKDISIAEDLVEEVARLYGYDHIVPDLPVFPIVPPVKNKLRGLARKIRRFLAYEQAYTEVYNYSFVSPEWLSQLHIDTDEHIELDNPIAKDRPLLRRNLIPNLLQNAESNLHRFESVKLFEVGRTYLRELAGERMRANSDDLLPKQDTVLGMVYAAKGDERPFYELAGSVRAVFERLGADISFHRIGEPGALPSHPGRYAEIKLRDAAIGKIGELHPEVQQHIGIPHRTAMLEIDMNAVLPHLKEKNSYTPLSTYPSVDRDIAFVVNRSVAHADIAAALRDVDPLVVDAALFDVYEGKGVPKGKKSMAYHLVYRSAERTLATEEVDRVHAEMVQTLTDAFDAEMRS